VKHWRAFSAEQRPRLVWLAVMPASLVIGIASEHASSYNWHHPRVAVPDLVVGLVFIGSALVVIPRRAGTGTLLVGTGLAWFFANVDHQALYLHRGPLVHLIVVYVGWRARRGVERVSVAVGYVAAVVTPIWSNDAAAVVLAVCLATVAVHRYASISGRLRNERTTALVAAAVVSTAIVAAVVTTRTVPDRAAVEPMLLAYELALCAAAIILAAGVVSPSATEVTDLVVELREARAGSLRDELAAVLRDPTLEIGYLSPTGEYRDDAGRTVLAQSLPVDRSATFVQRESRPYAVLVHDSTVLNEPTLVEAVTTATMLASAHSELSQELRTQIGEVQAARRRLMLADDDERRQLGVRMREGVELRVGQLAHRLRSIVVEGPASDHLARAEQLLTATLGDLADLARGLHPREVSKGLATAIASLTTHCPVQVELEVGDLPVLSDETASAVYFVCAEALANIVKHAAARHVSIDVDEGQGMVRVVVIDNGRGGADPARGSGILGLIDRVEAIGGSVSVSSPVGHGTRLTAEFPLGAPQR
jgi:signal transduction histidine kinase